MGQALTEETSYHDGLPISGNMLDYGADFRRFPADRGAYRGSNDPGRLVQRKPAKVAGFPAGAYQRGCQCDGRSGS